MEPAVASNVVPALGLGPRANFRGRGPGAAGRGGFDRGRGRIMPGRGHFMNAMGRGGVMGMGAPPPPQGLMMPGRGMRVRGPPAFPMRAGFVPRNGPQMRGARHASYTQPAKQHSGADNNKTISPTSNSLIQGGGGDSATINPSVSSQQINKAPNLGGDKAINNAQTDLGKHNSGSKMGVVNGSVGASNQNFSRGGRGRGGNFSRGGVNGRAGLGYNHNSNTAGYNSYTQPTANDQGQMNARRGSTPRGRGGSFGQNMQRPLINQHHMSNNQSPSAMPLKRGATTGPGSKRGRYEGSPYTQRSVVPNYQNHQSSMPAPLQPPHNGYNIAQPHQAPVPPPTSGYSGHESAQVVDPYTQQYNAANSHASYNGYAQSNYAAPSQGLGSNPSYVTQTGMEYDPNQYQNYGYTAQTDGRYQNYGQDYSNQYVVAGIDYNQTQQQNDYSQHHATQSSTGYDDRSFTNYDANYQQNYSNSTGYY